MHMHIRNDSDIRGHIVKLLMYAFQSMAGCLQLLFYDIKSSIENCSLKKRTLSLDPIPIKSMAKLNLT